jgi:hypothetical protein
MHCSSVNLAECRWCDLKETASTGKAQHEHSPCMSRNQHLPQATNTFPFFCTMKEQKDTALNAMGCTTNLGSMCFAMLATPLVCHAINDGCCCDELETMRPGITAFVLKYQTESHEKRVLQLYSNYKDVYNTPRTARTLQG